MSAPGGESRAATEFDARFLAHPAFSVFAASVRARLGVRTDFPRCSELLDLGKGLLSSSAPWFNFVPEDPERVRALGGFDRFIAETSAIPTRSASYHDLFGALIWLHFPALKTALHRAHLHGRSEARTPLENAATHLDESGVLVLSSDHRIFRALGDLEWTETLWEKRTTLLKTTRFLAFGHGLLDSLRAPHPRLMGKALFARVNAERLLLDESELRVFVDRELEVRLPGFLVEPQRLQPLPVLGIPGWSRAQSPELYADTRYFRRARLRSRAPVPAPWLDLESALR